VFDALTSERPYKKAWDLDRANSLIVESRGGHFDPDVVDAFFDVYDEVLAIKARYQDSDMVEVVPAPNPMVTVAA
jgi:putative two-component system response regulator